MKVTRNARTVLLLNSSEKSVTVPSKRKAPEDNFMVSKPSIHSQSQADASVSSVASSGYKIMPLGSSYLLSELKRPLQIRKDDIVDLVANRTLDKMLNEQKKLDMPFVLTQCQCSLHPDKTSSLQKPGSSHPEFLEGSLVYEKFDSDWFPTSMVDQPNKLKLKTLDKFAQNDFRFHLVNPFDNKTVLLASKAMMLRDIKDHRIPFIGAYTLNRIGFTHSESSMGAAFTAAMFHAGLRVKQDANLA